MSEFDSTLASLPEVLRDNAGHNWTQLRSVCSEEQLNWFDAACADAEFAGRLATVLACSQAFFELLRKDPAVLIELHEAGLLSGNNGDFSIERETLLAADSVEAFESALRRLRNRHWLRIVWRDLNRLADTTETTRDLSALAEFSLDVALTFHHRRLVAEWGEPCDADGNRQELVVIAMGKLGACELNLSSDIDLMFAYPRSGKTRGGPRETDNQQFFIKLGQRLIHALDHRSAEGFVFRMDMRLRPYGESGPLVINFDAMEEYYQDQGREWERYAMIKARAVAGDIAAGQQLLEDLRPFVYRRYVDFSVIEALREMKRMIRREVRRRRLEDDVKLGGGGIRDIEFIAQCFQLVRGGREQSLQERRLETVLDELLVLEQLPEAAVAELKSAYRFLRDTEHAVQAWLDRQTQRLPDSKRERVALAWAMGFGGDWEAYFQALESHREHVRRHFNNVIAEPEHRPREEQRNDWQDLLQDGDADVLAEVLEREGFEDSEEVARRLRALLDSGTVRRMQSVGRRRLYQFLPLLLDACTQAQMPGRCFLRILPLVEAVLRRTAYLVLLVENPGALGRLVTLCDASPWISRQLALHPVLLDELLNAHSLYSVPEKEGLQSELRQQLLRIPDEDQEAQMEALRYFKLAHVLRVAASEVVGTLSLMKVSDYLTAIAEVVLQQVLDMAWQTLSERHGQPPGCDTELPFIVVAYGKLGGFELSYGSDLDLVFIHGVDGQAVTDGDRPVDGATFFTRLGQRMIHILTTTTPLGELYEADMRLRPSGNSGLLVSSAKAFADYQHNSAWTWEHQALVRARAVAGGAALTAEFESLRHEVLSRPRDIAALRTEVCDMRAKMRDHLLGGGDGEKDGLFEVKQGRGGIVDIEFMVQYAVLAQAHQHGSLTRYSDNIRILESLQQEHLLDEAQALALIDAFKTLRSHVHRSSLQEEKGVVPASEVQVQRQVVIEQWQRWMEQDAGLLDESREGEGI